MLAQHNLANRYYYGEGVAKDPVQEVFWRKKAAEQGDSAAQSSLGVAYAEGYGVEKSAEEAVLWWSKAAEQNDAKAQLKLAEAYQTGEGVKADKAQSISLLIDCASHEDDRYGIDEEAQSMLSDWGGVEEDASSLSIKQLKKLLKHRRVDCRGCIERSDLVERLQASVQPNKASPPAPLPPSAPAPTPTPAPATSDSCSCS